MIGFAVLLLFVIVIGWVSFKQVSKIDDKADNFYNHPYQVRKAIGSLINDIQLMRISERDIMLKKSNKTSQDATLLLESSEDDADKQFEILKSQYLGPHADIEEANMAFLRWKVAREENTRLALSGEVEKAGAALSKGNVAVNREQMLAKIKVIDEFALHKADSLYKSIEDLKDMLDKQLLLLVSSILLLSMLVAFVLLRNIRRPLDILTDAAQRFHNGDMNARSNYRSKNEFGVLSASLNTMVESIQVKTELDGKVASLAGLMLSKYEAKEFFRETINALASHTGSNMAAVYLLSDDKKTFEHFESIGVDDNARQSFAADRLEGEFGAAIASRKIQHIRDIPKGTRFVFHTVSGKFIPREIITLPIVANNEIVAIISLASISIYSAQAIQLIDNILVTLSARVEGILAYHKINEVLRKLEIQNTELEAQKTELFSQSSELIEQNTELEMQKKQLNEASRLKTNFLSNMSHELRTPLNSVIALSGVLNRRLAKQIPEEEYSYLEVIERNGKHLLSLINDILDISRIESGREELEITRFNASNLIAEVVTMINPQAKLRNIELIQTDTATELKVTNDASKIRHVLQNLIGNAVKFTEKGKVEVKAQISDENIIITVSDTGVGIAEEHLAHIFDEFRQADGSTSRRFGGTGLGLAIAKKYSHLLGGTITVNSILGKGSDFILTLPVAYSSENRIIEKEETGDFRHAIKHIAKIPSSETSGKTILLVEDSEPTIIQMKDILEGGGYKIIVAHDGAEALGIIAHIIPDAMILDLMMPGIDGFEVLEKLRNAESTAHIPVLILSAKHITKEELKFLKRNNVHQLIQKGDVNREELMNSVSGMVTTEKKETVKTVRELQNIKGKPLILVVEDNHDNMITVKALLDDNYTVIEAFDGYEGIELAKKHLPHLILMDIALPGIDGIEAFKAIRNNASLQHIPVIALTASAMIHDRETILAYGFDVYITKPIDDKLFFKTINEVLYG